MPEPETKDEPQVDDNWTVDKKTWDESRQKVDQAEANAQKATQEAQAAKEEAESYAASLEESNAKIAELEKSVKSQQQAVEIKENQLEAMDDLTVDKSVINNLNKLKADLEVTKESLSQAQGKISQYETIEQSRLAQTQRNETIERIMTPLDEEFGAKYRNEAKKMADKLVDDGDEPQPNDAIEAMVLMRKCYKMAVDKDTKEKVKVPADAGGGGVGSPPEVKGQGTYDEVLADMRKTKSWKT